MRSIKSLKYLRVAHFSSSAKPNLLSTERFGTGSKVAVFMHGILGHKRNWRTPALVWMKQHPEYSCITVDHRGHGQSLKLPGPNSLESCALDFATTYNDIQNPQTPIDMIFGHSFGGKVVLKYLQRACEGHMSLPKHTWILDSIPLPYFPQHDLTPRNQSVFYVFDVIHKLPRIFESREWVVEEMVKEGLDRPIALWLATNVVPTSVDGITKYTWTFDLTTIRELFEDFCQTDLMDFLANYDGDGEIHFIR